MIVLKQGQFPTEIWHKKICRRCKAEFLYSRKDIVSVFLSEDCYDYVKCPTCGNRIRPSMFDRKVEVEYIGGTPKKCKIFCFAELRKER